MAKKPAKPASAELDLDGIDPDAQYTVQMAKAVKHGPTWLRPGSERLRVSGATLIEIADAVADYALVK